MSVKFDFTDPVIFVLLYVQCDAEWPLIKNISRFLDFSFIIFILGKIIRSIYYYARVNVSDFHYDYTARN